MDSRLINFMPHLFLLLILTQTSFPAVQAASNSFARCRIQSDCTPNLQCISINSSTDCSQTSSYCACLPQTIQQATCNSSSDCSETETCIPVPGRVSSVIKFPDVSVCVHNSQMDFVDLTPCSSVAGCPSHATCVTILFFSFCAASSSAEPPITQSPAPEPSLEPEIPDSTPVAAPLHLEQDSPKQTEDGRDQEQREDQPDDIDGVPVCIAAKSLQHLPENMLLYSKHIPARVLCDAQQSCATPGHMVLYNGRPMMMRTYCQLVQCRSAVMPVNSVRYQWRWRLDSHTHGLSFLAFAARYQTRVEEHMLRTAVRVGL
ncbi:hypothetical protein BWQ96_07702 [Gracilariopsis chorda]|uniref:Uncharacterized protein n=1 Tax=Gracilariopsis chorda TaxID=448386 RepID=A0A2V3IN45_9FLOR|nr:hypothetical protein BWQ96_07702 [Gracilariopsis chorda]|eukprot:PXF42540.1 hypothetical protein BWQ96_07702 [Gracilariopsis chorda]